MAWRSRDCGLNSTWQNTHGRNTFKKGAFSERPRQQCKIYGILAWLNIGLAGGLDRGQKDRRQDADDRDHNQQLDQRKAAF